MLLTWSMFRRRKRPEPEHLVGAQEIAELLKVTRQRVHQLSRDNQFPRPVAELAAGQIWRREDIEQWRDKIRPTTQNDPRAERPAPPPRDPERPQNDPWDADALLYLLSKPEGSQWSRGSLFECMREQGNRLKNQPDKVHQASDLAKRYGVDRRPDPGGKTIHFFRTDAEAPRPYPSSANERRTILRDSQ